MTDIDALMLILDKYDAGIVGEEADGTRRVAFSRTCEMIHALQQELFDQGFDLTFSETPLNSPLFLNIVPLLSQCDAVPQNQFTDFIWLPNKMGQYTFSKTAMAGISLRQLFLQLRSNFLPMILEDEPGKDTFFLHVMLCPDRVLCPSSQKHAIFSFWVFVFLASSVVLASIALGPYSEWVQKTLSTVYAKLQTYPYL